MEEKIKIESFIVDSSFVPDMKSWLQTKASAKDFKSDNIYLLSFHDDGVVWGKVDSQGKLLTSDENLSNSPSPKFCSKTLQELRLFGENGQLHIWRIGEGEFKASIGLESYLKDFELIDEKQVLWGTYFDGGNNEFMIVRDGEEGLRHAFPKNIDDDVFKVKDDKGNVVKDKKGKVVRKRPLRLHVKHYIEYDNDGCARIAFSRLVNVSVE